MKKQVIFTKDFATKKKGDVGTYDSSLAATLINEIGVAKAEKKAEKAKKDK